MGHMHTLFATNLFGWIHRFGGPGLILLGIADNSVVPLVGSMDVATIWLAASNREIWFYYTVMATIGAVIGGYITYALARKGGKEALEHKLPPRKADKLLKKFANKGFGAVMLSAMLPPPFPIVPVLLAAGALQYPRRKFLGALALGRGIRFTLVAGLGSIYGDAIVSFFSRYYMPALITLILLAVLGGVAALVQYLKYRHRTSNPNQQQAQTKVA